MTVLDDTNDVLNVDLSNKDTSSLRYALTFIKMAESTDEIHVPNQSINQTKKIYLSMDNFKLDQKCDVIVTYIVNPHHFYIQLTDNKKQIHDLNYKMQKVYGKCPTDSRKGMIYAPVEGKY